MPVSRTVCRLLFHLAQGHRYPASSKGIVMRIIALFNLKPGVSPESYETWARSVDLPTVNALPSIERFELFRTTGQLGSDAAAPHAYIEIIDVRDMERFGADVATAAMQEIAAAFQGMADVTFVTTEQIVA